MVAYVQALKRFRKGLDEEQVQPSPEDVPRKGFVSAPRQQAIQQTAEVTRTLYEPSKFVKTGMSQLRQARMTFQESLKNSPTSSKGSALMGGLAAAISKSTKKKEEAVAVAPLVPYKDAPDGPKGKESYSLPQQKGSANVKEDTAFIAGVKNLADKYGTTTAELMSLMHFESGGSFDPAKRNGIGATGLIQFIPKTAKGLGTSTEALAGMSRIEQLEWVDRYLAQTPVSKVEKPSGEDLYMSVLWPKAVGKPSDYVLWKEGSTEYKQNKGLDVGGKGYITKRDAAQKAMQYVDFYGDL